jgi:acyl phosphate:glycerol-3-phosphate acyltransferase
VSVLSVLIAYACGSLPFALWVARAFGTPDLRRVGSGNLGATNVARTSGVGAGVFAAVLDIGKGAASVLIAAQLTRSQSTTMAIAAVASVVGHVYPVWSRFQGGKGVATGFGAFAVLEPVAALPSFVVFVLGALATRYASVGSVLAAVTLPVASYVTGSAPAVIVAALATSALIVFRHRSNLSRLLSGTERRIGARA